MELEQKIGGYNFQKLKDDFRDVKNESYNSQTYQMMMSNVFGGRRGRIVFCFG